MKYIDEFRSKKLIDKVLAKIKEIMPAEKINIMEVCGTHTQSFYRFGLDKALPGNLELIAGPGCPVCVSAQEYIDAAIGLAEQKDTIIATFGDMLGVPGSRSTLEKEKARSGNVRIVYSALDSLRLARLNPAKKVVFLAVGFETTAPTVALSIISARQKKLKNLFFLPSLKLIPAAMAYLVKDKKLKLNGFLCPGHVSAIIGMRPYEFMAAKYKLGCCIAGFEPLDILEGLYLLLRQIVLRKPAVENQYARVVTRLGNSKAINIINRVFEATSASWRGLGRIPASGLKIRKEFSQFDAGRYFTAGHRLQASGHRLQKCRCGDILKGLISPPDCPLFSRGCRPDNPVGPCMVSSEGACNAYYKYKR